MAAKPKEPAFNLPACYALKANLPLVSMRLRNVTDDTLFFVFYGMPGDLAQLAAAVILWVPACFASCPTRHAVLFFMLVPCPYSHITFFGCRENMAALMDQWWIEWWT